MTDASDQPAPGSTPKFEHAAIVREVSEIGPNHRRVAFEVPAEQVKRFIMQLREVKQDIHPQETSTLLVRVCVDECLADLDRTSFFDPRLAEDVPPPVLHPEKPFIGTIDFDAFAEPDWPDFSLLTLAGNPIEVTDELVEREMLDQRLDAGRRSPSTDPLVENDEIDAALEIRLPGEDKPLLTLESVTARIPAAGGPANLGGMLLAGLDGATGHVAGDSVSFPTRLPANFESPDLRGRDVEAHLSIREARRVEPASEQEVADQYGSPSADVLRMQIRYALEARLKEDNRTAAADQLLPQLSELVPTSVPDFVVRHLVDDQLRRAAARAKKGGKSDEEIRAVVEELRPKLEKSAPKQAMNRVLCRQLATHLGVRVTEEEILQEIRAEAAKLGRRPEDLRQELVDSGRISNISDRALELMLADRLAASATVL